MNKYVAIVDQLEKDLDGTALDITNVLKRAELSTRSAMNTIAELRNRVLKTGFKTPDDEIHFFKHIKPRAYAPFIYYTGVLNIQNKKPVVSKACKEEYFNSELHNLQNFFDENREFYNYHRKGSTDRDQEYFTSGQHPAVIYTCSQLITDDLQFVSKHDITLAMIIAYLQLIKYLKNQIANLSDHYFPAIETQLNWTDQKVALVELIYALQHQGSFNNGSADLRQIADVFEQAFNIGLGDFYRAFTEIRQRKADPVRFINSLASSLEKRIDEADS